MTHAPRLLFLALLFISGLYACQTDLSNDSATADLIIYNAKGWTDGMTEPFSAVAVRADTIVAIGNDSLLSQWSGPTTQAIDAGGSFLCPGFIDAHVHFLMGGANLASVQLRDAATPQEFINRIAAFARTQPAGTWITGGDWNHELWGGELPSRQWIDSVTADHPVFLNRLDGHMALVNSKAFAFAPFGEQPKEVPGGAVVRMENGKPSGIFKDNAMSLWDYVVALPTPEQEDAALDAAMRYVSSHGVTAVHHMGTFHDLEVFQRNETAGRLITRIYAATPLSQWAEAEQMANSNGKGTQWLRWGMLKGFVDGSLGSHTAAFWEAFDDAPGDKGLLVNTVDDLQHWVQSADKAGLQVAVHAIGDRANELILDIFEATQTSNGPRDRRFRIEHAQHLRPQDIPRFATLDIIPSMQPYHAIDDGCWAEKVIGHQRALTTYAFKDLLDADAHLAFGSDWFVAPPIPLEGIYAAVGRQTLDGKNPDGWIPEQKISVEAALRAYTTGGAYAGFAENKQGKIAPGYWADMVLLDTDLLNATVQQIRQTKVLWTLAGGKMVYHTGNQQQE